MKIREVIVEADPNELGPMNPKMKDVLSKVHAGDVEQAKVDAAAKAKADAEKAAQRKAEDKKIIAFAKKHGYDLEPQDIGYFKKGVEDGKRGGVDRGAGEAYGPHFGAYYRGTQIGYKMKEQGEGLGEGGFFDPDQPNPGDMVKHRNGAVGKVKKIGTQGDETFVYFRDQNGEMNYGLWKKHVFPVKDTAKKTESLDKDGYHKSVENGEFMKSKYGRGDYKNAMFLHDLDRTGEPMLVTFARQDDAEKAVKQYGGTIIKSGMGTFRIVKDGDDLEESATAGATSAGNIASVEAPHLSPGDARGKKSYIGDPRTGVSGKKAPKQPKAKQPKKKDGTAVNALDMKASIFGSPIKR